MWSVVTAIIVAIIIKCYCPQLIPPRPTDIGELFDSKRSNHKIGVCPVRLPNLLLFVQFHYSFLQSTHWSPLPHLILSQPRSALAGCGSYEWNAAFQGKNHTIHPSYPRKQSISTSCLIHTKLKCVWCECQHTHTYSQKIPRISRAQSQIPNYRDSSSRN